MKSTKPSRMKMLSDLRLKLGQERVIENYPLKNASWMKVGGPADYFFIATSRQDIIDAVSIAILLKIPYTILGGGSNILIKDGGIRGLVIQNRAAHIAISPKEAHHIQVESGVFVNQLVGFAIQNSLAGIEEFLGIPGTVGGAIYNNSHHLDHLIGDYVESVEVLDTQGQVKWYTQADMEFAYDYSVLHETKETILSAVFALSAGDQELLTTKSRAALQRRRDTQPLEIPSSGCMFQNIGGEQAEKYDIPQNNTSAGFLIDKAGLKGLQVGGAKVSDVHANFIVNTGTATAKDIIELSEQVARKVHEKYGVTLKREVFFIGED